MGERLILSVDPGEVRIGLAISDSSATIARPLKVFRHRSRSQDARTIAEVAASHDAILILVGLPLDAEGQVGHQARRSLRLVEALELVTSVPIETWDESGTTQFAGPKDEMIDARAAAHLLQDYLDHGSKVTR